MPGTHCTCRDRSDLMLCCVLCCVNQGCADRWQWSISQAAGDCAQLPQRGRVHRQRCAAGVCVGGGPAWPCRELQGGSKGVQPCCLAGLLSPSWAPSTNVAVYIDSDVLQVRGCVRAEGQQGLQPCSEWYAVVTGPVLAFCQGCAKWGWDGLAQCFCAGKLRVLLHRPQHRFGSTSQSLPHSAPFVDSWGSFRPSVRPQQAVSTSAPPCMCCCVSVGAWRHGARAFLDVCVYVSYEDSFPDVSVMLME
jgi:hypothetical protein